MIPHSKPTLGPEESRAVARVIESGQLAQGREVAAFEAACAAFTGRRHGVAVSSGTAALHLALLGMGVKAGDAVAVPSYACAALAQAVSWIGANPIPCDVDQDFLLDPACVPDAAAVSVVAHLFGAHAPLPGQGTVIEDIAQSLGGPTGRSAPVAVASFYATKMMTTGEGGMVLTDDEGLADDVRDRRDYDHRDDFRVRYAYKMTEFQAAMGLVQLQRLPSFVARRQEIAAAYHQGLAGAPVRRPRAADSVYFRYVIATPAREELTAWLRSHGIDACRPVHGPLHHHLGGDCPRSTEAHNFNVSLPIYPALTTREVEFVIQCVLQFFEVSGR
jgi:perosamine synthetase